MNNQTDQLQSLKIQWEDNNKKFLWYLTKQLKIKNKKIFLIINQRKLLHYAIQNHRVTFSEKIICMIKNQLFHLIKF